MLDLIKSMDWGDVPTWIAAFVAAPAVFFAARQVRLAAEQNVRTAAQEEDSLRPIIVATMESVPEKWNFVDFCIKNAGQGPAYNVSVNFSKLPQLSSQFEDHPFWKAAFLNRTIPVIAPSQEYRSFADGGPDRERENITEHLGEVTISYTSITGKEFVETSQFDISLLRDSLNLSVRGLDSIARELEKIRKQKRS